MSDPDNLRLYASIFRKPRRYSAGAQLMPPSFIEMEAAQALEEKADRLDKGIGSTGEDDGRTGRL